MKDLYNKIKSFVKNNVTDDKKLHFLVSALLTEIFYDVGIPLWIAMLITLGIGIGKELYDKYVKKTMFDVKDLIADIVGILIGGIFKMIIS